MILNLVGLMAMRNPRLRETMQSFEDRIFKHVAQAMVATPERWNGVVQQVRESGTLTREHPVDYETMKDFVERDEYTVKTDLTYQIGLELRTFDDLLPLFSSANGRLCAHQKTRAAS